MESDPSHHQPDALHLGFEATIANQNSKMIGVNGVLIIDKPAGITSHDVVARVRNILRVKRVGHTGTLDPFATGVLVILVGRATRLAQFLSGAEKEYAGVIRLGYATNTGDATGTRIETRTRATAANLSLEEIETAMSSLRGEIEQTPPMFSARKVGGEKLYELARRGKEVERKSARVQIFQFHAVSANDSLTVNDDETCDIAVHVVCSAGTYVRVLAEDLGHRLGLGAHLCELRRTRAGHFRVEQALLPEQLAELSDSDLLAQVLISPDTALSHLPSIDLSSDDVHRVVHGINLQIDGAGSNWKGNENVRMRDPNGDLVAIGAYDVEGNYLHPRVVIAN